jgi:hypothetical protein
LEKITIKIFMQIVMGILPDALLSETQRGAIGCGIWVV